MRQILRFLAPLLVIAALAAACGDDSSEVVAGDAGDGSTTTVDPDTAVSSPPLSDDGSDPALTWTRIEPTEDLVDPNVATPDEIIPDPDDPNAVLVHFYGGVQECFGARAAALETADSVEVTLELGGQPDAGDQACIEIAEAQELVVALDAPLGDRELVAATGERG